MKKALPFVSIDAGLHFNLVMLMVVLSRLAVNSKDRYVLEFERLQFFLYLVKNPARIEPAITHAGKKIHSFDSRYTHTIESMSSNVDILFHRGQLRSLLAELASLGFLGSVSSSDGHRTYHLSDEGEIFLQLLLEEDHQKNGYLASLIKFTDGISGLQSLPLSKISSIMNKVFREEVK